MRQISTYSSSSSFVQEYAVCKNGLVSSLPCSGIVDSSEKVVIIDALLRKHYTELTVNEIAEVTELSESLVIESIGSLVDNGLLVSDDGSHKINKSSDRIGKLRQVQKNTIASTSVE